MAIKVLPDHLADDADRLGRFQREAKVLASLNHTSIAAIYGSEEFEGKHTRRWNTSKVPHLTSILREGHCRLMKCDPSCGAILPRHSKPPTRMVLFTADLKPANVIAVPMARSRCSTSASPARWKNPRPLHPMESKRIRRPAFGLWVQSPTMSGVILGTAGMSPEQGRQAGRQTERHLLVWLCAD